MSNDVNGLCETRCRIEVRGQRRPTAQGQIGSDGWKALKEFSLHGICVNELAFDGS
jgi:hypothetical protein